MTENYEQELKLIDGATDGPWFVDQCWTEDCRIGSNNKDGTVLEIATAHGYQPSAENDAEYIAHFNPSHMRQRIEREMAKDAENEKLKRENAELKAMVNELHLALLDIQMITDNTVEVSDDNTEKACLIATKAIKKTPAQSLRDHDLAIAQNVWQACDDAIYPIVRQYTTSASEVSNALEHIDLVAIVNGAK